MTPDEALAAAECWVPIPDANEAARVLAVEVRQLRRDLAAERARRTLGGVPPELPRTRGVAEPPARAAGLRERPDSTTPPPQHGRGTDMTAAVEMLADDADWAAVHRLVTGHWNHRQSTPRPADQIAAAAKLHQAGESAPRIAELVGTNDRQIARWRSLGLLST